MVVGLSPDSGRPSSPPGFFVIAPPPNPAQDPPPEKLGRLKVCSKKKRCARAWASAPPPGGSAKKPTHSKPPGSSELKKPAPHATAGQRQRIPERVPPPLHPAKCGDERRWQPTGPPGECEEHECGCGWHRCVPSVGAENRTSCFWPH